MHGRSERRRVASVSERPMRPNRGAGKRSRKRVPKAQPSLRGAQATRLALAKDDPAPAILRSRSTTRGGRLIPLKVHRLGNARGKRLRSFAHCASTGQGAIAAEGSRALHRAVEMHHTRLQAQRPLAQIDEFAAAAGPTFQARRIIPDASGARDACSDSACAGVSSPSVTARRNSSQEAICISRVVSRMLSVA